jgi:catechol 2,3-dioxygenase-like lactoylglutathione lyase family enzyme
MANTTYEIQANAAASEASFAKVDMKLEVVVIPVSDVDRAREFYSRLGWRLDADRSAGDNFRLVQFKPPGSGSSIQFGVNLTSAAPGWTQRDANWADWYAAYMVAEQSGKELPQ